MNYAVKEPNSLHHLWIKFRENQDSLSRETLVKQYVHLVEQMAGRMSVSVPERIFSKEDLMSLGYIGLLEAIEKFDYTKGYQFETFGLWRIKGAMLDGIRKMDWIPRGVRDKAKRLNSALRELEQQFLRSPTDAELSDYLNLSLDEVDETMSALSLSTVLSLNETLPTTNGEGKDQTRIESIVDEQNPSQEQHIQMEEFKTLMADVIDQMPEKERLVISLFYYEGLSKVEIADVLNLTKGRISQIHTKAILRLRQAFHQNGYSLDSFL
ncbi:FliA/WhiG family RNA polymerase sigma factor [Pullulanibacillus sp. KACC 23026]|uniref:sigma-70 family RNA polymerase sigma factor n=1 Tax=Pullulanibacillus sp. KACC 23026 TaxID=3028315 RepID=UPI0023AF762F|nr:FliA/WhiG family RNA polymerase sigma factor [Pullulanibacillus sp. KACC 23026]WEG11222.1 FliA/WhiG family RNA polymerase sigma factor [Pullulanibacillus sp. KACC 23026]